MIISKSSTFITNISHGLSGQHLDKHSWAALAQECSWGCSQDVDQGCSPWKASLRHEQSRQVTHWVASVSLLFWVTGSSPKGCSQHRTDIIKVSDASENDQDRSQDHFLNRFIEIDFTYPTIFIHIFRVLYLAMMSNYNHAKISPTPPEDHSPWQWLLQALLGLGNHSLQDLTL